MAISEKAFELLDFIYKTYRSNSGCLFGIEPDKRHAVEAIVQVILDKLAKEE